MMRNGLGDASQEQVHPQDRDLCLYSESLEASNLAWPKDLDFNTESTCEESVAVGSHGSCNPPKLFLVDPR